MPSRKLIIWTLVEFSKPKFLNFPELARTGIAYNSKNRGNDYLIYHIIITSLTRLNRSYENRENKHPGVPRGTDKVQSKKLSQFSSHFWNYKSRKDFPFHLVDSTQNLPIISYMLTHALNLLDYKFAMHHAWGISHIPSCPPACLEIRAVASRQ